MRIYSLYCDILFMKILKLFMLLSRGIMATPLNNRAESKIEAATLAARLDKKVELKHTDLVKMLFIAIS